MTTLADLIALARPEQCLMVVSTLRADGNLTLPNSFLKRQLDIAPGWQRTSWSGRAMTLLDQGDLVIGIWVCLLPIYVLSVPDALLAFVVISAVHFGVNLVGYAVGARTARV